MSRYGLVEEEDVIADEQSLADGSWGCQEQEFAF